MAVRLFVVLGGLCSWGVASPVAPGRLDDVPGFGGMRDRWSALMSEFEVPGMAVAIVKDGKIAAIEGFGVRKPDASGAEAAVTADTMFYIASITKTYLATAVCTLADEGKLSLDDPVVKHLPRFAVADGGGLSTGSITIRDLLSHKVGFTRSEPIVTLDAFTGEITEDRYYRWLAEFSPGGQTNYSNVHYTLLGRVVEAAGGKPWRDYLEERIFQPAGLTRTSGYASRMCADPDCAIPMERPDGQWKACKLRKSDRTMHAAGGLGASATDAARWLLLHLGDGEIERKRIVSAHLAREMRTLQSPFAKKQGAIRVMEGFGLGWQVGTFHGTPLCSHGGGYAGASAYYAILPDIKSGFAVLMNASGSANGLQDVIAVDILDRLIKGDEPIDVLDAYRNRLAEHKKRTEARTADRQAQLARPFVLALPIQAYCGQYQNADLGTIRIQPDGLRFKVFAGECELEVAAEGSEAFKVAGPILEGTSFRFLVTSDAARGVSVEVPQLGTFLYTK